MLAPSAPSAPAAAVPVRDATQPSSLGRVLCFRFALLYLALYTFPFPFDYIWGLDRLAAWLVEGQHHVTHALGIHLFGLPDQLPRVGGCGDRAEHFVTVPLEAATALAAAVLWSIFDRRRNHARLAYWASACLRYYLAHTMLEYGVIKLFKSQFPLPRPSQLATPLGELTPMNLLWAFMGISTAYCTFIGLCEAVGGLLLFFRRTALLGALLSFGVLTNVFLLNVFYGVCVKLFSAHLLLMTSLLLAPHARHLIDALILNRGLPARDLGRPSYGPTATRAFTIIKLVVVPAILALSLDYSYGAWHLYGDAAPQPPFYGVWDVELFAPNGQPAPAAPNAWRWLAIESGPYATVRSESGATRAIGLRVDTQAHVVHIRLDPNDPAAVSAPFTTPEPDTLELELPLDGALTRIRLEQRRFPLLSPRFRWTSDLP